MMSILGNFVWSTGYKLLLFWLFSEYQENCNTYLVILGHREPIICLVDSNGDGPGHCKQ